MKKFSLLGPMLIGVGTLFCASAVSADADYDPLYNVNMRVHTFNEFMDRNLLRPVANGYVRYVPSPARRGVSNFFSNIGDIRIFVNNVLQLKPEAAANDFARVLMNTTVGIGGIFDVASTAGLEKNSEDFGQTLGYWGVGPGPYVVLPFLGPSTFRDSLGLLVDTATNPLNHQDNVRLRNSAYALEQIDRRVSLLAAESLMQGDPYIFMREAYLQQRQYLVTDGETDDAWDDDWDWD